MKPSGDKLLTVPQRHSRFAASALNLIRKRDICAGGLMMLFGLVMLLHGPSYGVGTLTRMKPGFLPTILGVILIGLGIAIAATALRTGEGDGEDSGEGILPEHPEWRAWACILASPFAFMLFGTHFGMAPGAFACVFVAAMGAREATLRSSFILAAAITVFGAGVFSYILQIPMPIFVWRGL